MVSFYRFFRWFVFLLFILFSFFVFVPLNHTQPVQKFWEQAWNTPILSSAKAVRKFIFYDAEQEKMKQSFQLFQDRMEGILLHREKILRSLSTYPAFQERVFLYYLKQNEEGFKPIVEKFFGGLEDFEDFILLNSDKKLIYKYAGKTFSVQFLNLSQSIDFRFDQGYYSLFYNLNDSVLNQRSQMVVYFDYSEIIKLIRSWKGTVFCYINHTLIRSPSMNRNLFRRYNSSILKKREIYAGFQLIRVFPLKIGDKIFAYAGMVFPYRRIQLILERSFKILLFLLFPFILFLFDRFILNRMKLLEIQKREQESLGEIAKKVSLTKNTESDSEDEKLIWLESYIKKESEDDK